MNGGAWWATVHRVSESEATEHTGSAYGADTVWLHTHDAPVSVPA